MRAYIPLAKNSPAMTEVFLGSFRRMTLYFIGDVYASAYNPLPRDLMNDPSLYDQVRFVLKLMNSAINTMNFDRKWSVSLRSGSEDAHFVFKMMDSALKMMNIVFALRSVPAVSRVPQLCAASIKRFCQYRQPPRILSCHFTFSPRHFTCSPHAS